jgi:hypothetical protein
MPVRLPCYSPIVITPGTNPTHIDSARPTPFEVGYRFLATAAAPLPNARAAIVAAPSTGAARWVQKWETLTDHIDAPKRTP